MIVTQSVLGWGHWIAVERPEDGVFSPQWAGGSPKPLLELWALSASTPASILGFPEVGNSVGVSGPSLRGSESIRTMRKFSLILVQLVTGGYVTP